MYIAYCVSSIFALGCSAVQLFLLLWINYAVVKPFLWLAIPILQWFKQPHPDYVKLCKTIEDQRNYRKISKRYNQAKVAAIFTTGTVHDSYTALCNELRTVLHSNAKCRYEYLVDNPHWNIVTAVE